MSEEEISTETTGLTSGVPKPRYAFESGIQRTRKRRVRQFQCCICAIFLGIIIIAVVTSVAFSIHANQPLSNITQNNISDAFMVLIGVGDAKNENIYIDGEQYDEALSIGMQELRKRDEIEKTTPELDVRSSSYKHQKVVATSEMARLISRVGYVEEFAARNLNANRTNVATFCRNNSTSSLYCDIEKLVCNIYHKFRAYNGTCNNLEEPYGVAYKPFRRILPPDYADGISAPRMGKNGKILPSARTVSLVVHRPIYRDDPNFTVMLAVFGQFMDHDITATALNQGRDGKSIACCENSKHPECFPVKLDVEDPYYEKYNVTCMEFVRSAAAATCCLGPRQQLNQATSFIDASVIYGSTKDVVDKLRTFRDGKLEMFVTDDNRTLLPKSNDPNDGCNNEEENKKGRYCFTTGDARANENLHLTSMHLIWARHHNYIAVQLQELNPHWCDERLFQESRRIVIAQLQHISYNEFLPVLLGDFVHRYDLLPLRNGYYHGYNSSLDASIANSFAASAFRFAHTLIPSLIKMIGNGGSVEAVQLHEMLLDPFRLYKNGELDSAIRGATKTPIQANDNYFTPELKGRMFSRETVTNKTNGSNVCGLDLVSLNIQRGRDHGLPGYTSWREHCGLKRPRTFEQLKGDIDYESLRYIESIYSDVDDIDFYTGSLSEKPLKNSFLGPTITCILLDQFIRIKRGDRFWYENPTKPQAFTPDQLQEIRKTSLANIICINSDNVRYLQARVMKRADESNRIVHCKLISTPNFRHWKEDLHRVSVGADHLQIISI